MRCSRFLLTLACAAVLALAGCTASNDAPPPPRVESGATATVAPGSMAHLPLFLAAGAGNATDATASVQENAGLNVTAPSAFHVSDNGTLAAWVGFSVPADAAPGEREVVVRVSAVDAAPRDVAFTITVPAPGAPVQEGRVALSDVTARTTTGAIAFTTVRAIAEGPFPHAPGFQAPEEYAPMPLAVSPQARLPHALSVALANASVGHSFSARVPEAFGPASVEREEARVEEVDRFVQEPRVFELPRATLEAQGLIDADSREGDRLRVPGPLPYVVDHLNETDVRILLDLARGDALTLYPAWPNATVVVAVAEDVVTLRTTPPVEEGERFTWRDGWPGATEIARQNETRIVLRHSPEEGVTYTDTTAQGQPVNLTVKALKDDVIVVSQANPHPLGGETLVFEVTVVDEQDAPAPAQ